MTDEHHADDCDLVQDPSRGAVCSCGCLPKKPQEKKFTVFHATDEKCPNCEITLLDIEVRERRCFMCGWSEKSAKDKR